MSLSLERELVAGLLDSPERFEGLPQLQPVDFFDPKLGIIYRTLRSLAESAPDVSLTELYQELNANDEAERVGGHAALLDLIDDAPAIWNPKRVAGAVLLASRKREQETILKRSTGSRENGGLSTESLERLQEISREIEAYEQGQLGKGPEAAPAFLAQSYEEIDRRAVRWLWPRYIPLGMVTILDGDSGIGKSTVLLDIASRLSRGALMPDNSVGSVREGKTAILSLEDPKHEVMRPKLDRSGAKLENILDLVLKKPGRKDLAEVFLSEPETLEALERVIVEKGITMLQIDPLFGFTGDVSTSVDSEIRGRVLGPLAQIAERTGCAIVCVRHVTKDLNRSAKHKGGGSVGITAVARSLLYIEKHPEEDDLYVLSSAKMNLLKAPPSLGYRIRGDDPLQPDMWIEWTGQVNLSADELAQAASNRSSVPTKREKIADWLALRLGDGEHVSAKALAAEIALQFESPGDGTVLRARKEAGVMTQKAAEFQGGWVWFIPQS